MCIKEFTLADNAILLAYLELATAIFDKICSGETDGSQEKQRAEVLLFGLKSAQSHFKARSHGPATEDDETHFACSFVVANMLLLFKQSHAMFFSEALKDLGKEESGVNLIFSQVAELLSRLQNPT